MQKYTFLVAYDIFDLTSSYSKWFRMRITQYNYILQSSFSSPNSSRRGQHGRERGHELLRIRGHPLRQYRPVGQGASGKEDCLFGGRAQGVPAQQGRFAHPVGNLTGQPSLQQRHHREGTAGHGGLREPRAVRQGGQEAQPVED